MNLLDNHCKVGQLLKCGICGAEPGVDCDRSEKHHYMIDRNPEALMYWQYSVVVDGRVLTAVSGEAAEEVARAKAEKVDGVVVKRPVVAERWVAVDG